MQKKFYYSQKHPILLKQNEVCYNFVRIPYDDPGDLHDPDDHRIIVTIVTIHARSKHLLQRP